MMHVCTLHQSHFVAVDSVSITETVNLVWFAQCSLCSYVDYYLFNLESFLENLWRLQLTRSQDKVFEVVGYTYWVIA